ncbi:MAG TPA: hypothetical protein DIS75_06295 [Chryseobacterium sp.]|nr:hypothetical protein [Chryseobacterium sp.]
MGKQKLFSRRREGRSRLFFAKIFRFDTTFEFAKFCHAEVKFILSLPKGSVFTYYYPKPFSYKFFIIKNISF